MNGQETKKAVTHKNGRGPVKNTDLANDSAQPTDLELGSTRTTAVLPVALNQNWEAYALREGRSKNEVLVQALREFLKDKGLQPDRKPKRIEIVY